LSLKNLKPNVTKVLLESYIHTILGVRKTGKTTLFYELLLEKYNDLGKGLLIPLERGYNALDGLMTTDDLKVINTWSDFNYIVDLLVAEKQDLDYKIVCIDTIDMMVELAEKEAIRFYNMKVEPSKRARTINEAGGGYGRGKAYAKIIIRDALNKISKAGYGIFLIGHSKDKTVKEKDGTEYNFLSCNLTSDYTDILLDASDIITFLTVEKEIEDNRITQQKVYMNFRSDSIDCGGRFKHLPGKIEYSARNYIETFEEAVRYQLRNRMKHSESDIKELSENEEDILKKQSTENISKMVELPKIKESIKDEMRNKINNKNVKPKQLKDLMLKYNINIVDELEDLQMATDLFKEVSNL